MNRLLDDSLRFHLCQRKSLMLLHKGVSEIYIREKNPKRSIKGQWPSPEVTRETPITCTSRAETAWLTSIWRGASRLSFSMLDTLKPEIIYRLCRNRCEFPILISNDNQGREASSLGNPSPCSLHRDVIELAIQGDFKTNQILRAVPHVQAVISPCMINRHSVIGRR